MWVTTWGTHMKRKGKHPEKALSAARVRTIKEPGRHADGNGLYLIVDPVFLEGYADELAS